MPKRFLALLSVLLLSAALTACGEVAPPEETSATNGTTTTAVQQAQGDIATPQNSTTAADASSAPAQQADGPQAQTTQVETPANTQFGPLYQKFVREPVADGVYTLSTSQSGMRMIMTTDGKNSVLESDAAGILHFTLISKDGQYYMLMHNTKKYAQMTSEEYKKQADSLGNAAVRLDGVQLLRTGSETVAGTTYSTETYDEGNMGTVTYFFDDTGVRRARVVKDGKTTDSDVFEISGDADASAFEIPDGYTLVSDPSQLLA
ncbi:MAG: hypothetical protein IJT44_03230 [Clostridia bacterium]|nr:hypothetical protein [Clostridia bacterium]